jgi:hypothetical protein
MLQQIIDAWSVLVARHGECHRQRLDHRLVGRVGQWREAAGNEKSVRLRLNPFSGKRF